MGDRHWTLQDYAQRIKSVEIVKHRPTPTLTKSVAAEHVPRSPRSVTTPDRKIINTTPGRTVCIRGSPKGVRYRSKRRIEF